MKNEIQQLQSEIEAYQNEIGKLRGELKELTAPSTDQNLESPADVAEVVRAKAAAQPVIVGLQNAITKLQSGLEKKQKQLISFEKAALEDTKRERLELGRQKLRIKSEQLKELGNSIEDALLEIKALSEEFSIDYREIHCSQQSGFYQDYSGLVHLGVACSVPQLVEAGDKFSLAVRTIDLFAPDRQAMQTKLHADRAQIEGRLQQSIIRTQSEIQQRQSEALMDKRKGEQEGLEQLLIQKRADLLAAEGLREQELIEVRRGVKLDLSRLNTYISTLSSEIHALETRLEKMAVTLA